MSELEQQNFANKPRNRRAIVKGAAWSVPVIAAAIAAPAASASTASTDLGIAFGGSQTLTVGILGSLLNANVTLANTLTVTNLGTSVSTGGEVLTLTFPSTLSQLTLVSADGLATITILGTTATIILPVLAPGASEVINLGLVSLPLGVLTGPQTINASLAANDTNAANNTASSTVGITVL